MKRPAFQFYPADWRQNSKLGRCSFAARGAWMNVLCVLHDEDEYGVARYPLKELASAAGISLALAKELAEKGVLKGADKDAAPFVFTPKHAGRAGDSVTLVEPRDGPCWYCSRFVRDEYVRMRRGAATQFTTDNQPPKQEPKSEPMGGIGERQGDGASSSSSTTERKAKSSLRSDSSSGEADDLQAKRELRLKTVTLDAIAAYNEALAKPHGVLPSVRTTVGMDTRKANVRRCVKVASEICQETYKAPAITPAFWADYFALVKADPFKSGEQEPGRGHENWQPDFEYLTRPKTMLQVFDKAESEAA